MKMNELRQECNCYVKGATAERKEFFESVCKDGSIPIVCPIPTEYMTHETLKGKVPITKIALDRLSEEEHENLIEEMMKRFKLSRQVVISHLGNKGCPIRLDSSVIVIWCELHSRMVH